MKEDPIIFYKQYHKNETNIFIHKICIPILIITFLGMCENYWCLFIFIFYNSLYYGYKKYDWCCFLYLSILFISGILIRKILVFNQLLLLHIASWLGQFIGHLVFEKNSPALFHSFINSILWAPLAVYLEY